MRLINRNAHILLNAARHNTSLARDELDKADLELRGVEYELGKVREETKRCEEYEAGYRDLQLPSVEDFLAEAGEEVVGALRECSSVIDIGEGLTSSAKGRRGVRARPHSGTIGARARADQIVRICVEALVVARCAYTLDGKTRSLN